MGLLDSITDLAKQGIGAQETNSSDPGTHTQVAGGVMQALDEHPGGLAGILDHFKNNGMQQEVQGWSTGQQSTATPDQIHQGLAGSGFIENVASKAGVSPQVAEVAMATVLPMVMAHFTQNGQSAPPQSGFGGMASQILGRFL